MTKYREYPQDFIKKGANWIRPDSKKRQSRVVVGQLATLKADHILCAEDNLVLAA